MSNRRYNQFFYSFHAMPIHIDLHVPIGASGAVGTIVGAGVSSVVRNAAGIYQINFQDQYQRLLSYEWAMSSPNSGSSILVASAGVVSGTTYVITILGTTTTAGWQSLGLGVGITPAVGVAFKATATTTAAGTGAVQVPLATGSGVQEIELVGVPNLTLYPTGIGAASPYLIVQVLGPTNSSTTTPVATDPANGSTMRLDFLFSNSSVQFGTAT